MALSLQAGNTWMLRETARLQHSNGNLPRSAELSGLANLTQAATLSLYEPGQGFFSAAYPNGSTVPVRTCVDFLSVANSIPLKDVP